MGGPSGITSGVPSPIHVEGEHPEAVPADDVGPPNDAAVGPSDDLVVGPAAGTGGAPTGRPALPALPELPAVIAEVRASVPVVPVEDVPETPTSQARINELATTVSERLLAGDTIGALDALHGVRGGEVDHLFPRRFNAALEMALVSRMPAGTDRDLWLDSVRGRMSNGEQVLFDAYVNNPDGLSRPEDIVFLAVDGAGTGEEVINDAYTDLATRFRGPDGFDREGYEAAVAEMDQRYLEQYGERRDTTSLEEDLSVGFWSELGGNDRAEFRAARAQTPEALQLYLAGQGRRGAEPDRMLSVLLENAHRMEDFASEYGYVADGEEGQGLERLEAMIADELRGVDAERARALLDTSIPLEQRAAQFGNLTLQGVLDLEVGHAEATRILRALTEGDDRPLGPLAAMSLMDRGLLEQVRVATTPSEGQPQGASYARLNAEMNELNTITTMLAFGEETVAGEGLVAEFQTHMARPGDYLGLGAWLDSLTQDERAELLAEVPDLEARLLERYPFPEIQERLVGAGLGNADSIDFLHWVTESTARENELMPKVLALGAHDRASFAERYDERYGEGSFQEALDRLDTDTARSLQIALTAPTGQTRAQLETMTDSFREIIGQERGEEGWVGVSTWFTDTFGFSGPVVDDSLREAAYAAQEASAYYERTGELRPEHVRAMMNAQRRLQSTLSTYVGEREDLADTAADIAIGVTSIMLVGGGISLAALRNAALVGGTVNTGTHAVIEGPNYGASEAVYDFFAGAAYEVAGVGIGEGVVRGGGLLWNTLRP